MKRRYSSRATHSEARFVPYKRPRQRTFVPRPVPAIRRSTAEKNFVDTTISQTPTVAAGTLQLLNGMVPGTGSSDRVGRKVVLTSIQVRISMNLVHVAATGAAYTNTSPSAFSRAVLVWDTQPNAAAATIANVFATQASNSLTNLDNRDRFRILWDKVINPGNQSSIPASTSDAQALSATQYGIKKYKKCRLTTIFNSGTAGDVTDITSGALYLMCLSSAAGGAVNPTEIVTINGFVRVRYLDV